MTAIYGDADLSALFHYCLSISIKHSFQTGAANLALFFKKNKKAAQQLEVADKPSANLSNAASRDSRGVKAICTRFMRLHGILFEASRRRSDTIMSSSAEEYERASSQNELLEEQSYVEFGGLLPSVLDGVSSLVVHGQLSEGTLLKIITICIFSAHRYLFEEFSHQMEPAVINSEVAAIRSTAGSYSLVLLFSFVNRLSLLAERYRKLVPLIQTPLVAFTEWVIQHRSVLQQVQPPSALLGPLSNKKKSLRSRTVDANSSGDAYSGVWFVPASGDTLLLEGRARSGMRTSLVSLLNALDPNNSVTAAMMALNKVPSNSAGALATPTLPVSTQTVSVEPSQLYAPDISCLMPSPLREFVELRGFVPVAERIEGYFSRYFFKDFKDQAVLESAKAKQVRLFLLRQFVDKVLSIAPLYAIQIPASTGGLIGKTSKLHEGHEARRYQPGTSSAMASAGARDKRIDKRLVDVSALTNRGSSRDKKSGCASGKRARSSPLKRVKQPPADIAADLNSDLTDERMAKDVDISRNRRRRSEDIIDDVRSSSDESEEVCSETLVDDFQDVDAVLSDDGNAEVANNDYCDEDDDEVIVFKPSFSRYNDERSCPKLISDNVYPRLSPQFEKCQPSCMDADTEKVGASAMPMEWLGALSPDKSRTVSSALSWSHFGDSIFPEDPEGERILQSLRLGNASPNATESSNDVYGNLLKPSVSDPSLWFNAVSEVGDLGLNSKSFHVPWIPSDNDNPVGYDVGKDNSALLPSKWRHPGSSPLFDCRAPPPGFEEIGVKSGSRNPPPGFFLSDRGSGAVKTTWIHEKGT